MPVSRGLFTGSAKRGIMERLFNGFELEIPRGAFPLSTDSMVLSYFARPPRGARILDLGAGCGTLGVLLCAGNPDCNVTGIELCTEAHNAALANIRRNGLASRMESICGDLRQVPSLFPPGSFSFCVSNPPYFSGGPVSQALPLARREDCCSLQALFDAAAWALKYGGDFCLVHRPERLGEIIAQGARVHLEAKRLCLVRHRADRPVSLVLVQLRKGGKPGLGWEEITLQQENGEPTDVYRKIYHI